MIQNILSYIEGAGPFAYFFVFLTACIESAPFVGAFTPGTALLVFFGYLVSVHTLGFFPTIVCAFLGAVVGDLIGYYMGKYGIHFLEKHKKWLSDAHISAGEKFFKDHGGKSIFIGRFFGPLRAILSVVAGMAKMPFIQFNIYNIAGAIIWVHLYILIGFFFGAEWKIIQRYVTKYTTEAVILLIVIGIVWYIRKKYKAEVLQDLQK